MEDSLVLSVFLTASNKKFLITQWFTMVSMISRTEQIQAVFSSAILPLGVLTGGKHCKNVLPLWKCPAVFTEES